MTLAIDLAGDAETRRTQAPHAVAVLGCVLLLAAAAYLLNGAAGPLSELSFALAKDVKANLADRSLPSLIEAALGTAAWAMLLVAKPLAIFLAFLAVEWLLVGRPASLRNSLFFVGVQALLVLLYYFANPWLQKVLPHSAFQPLVMIASSGLPQPVRLMGDVCVYLAVLLANSFVGYWVHRAQHEVPLLWRFHAVHHSIEDMEAVKDASHPFDILGEHLGLFLIGALVGFDYHAMAWLMALDAVRGRMTHSRAPINFGPLGWLLVDNRFHFTHHSIREKYYDRNYGAFTTLWDRLFGTHEPIELEALEETGMRAKLPARNLWQFFTARLDPRPAPAIIEAEPDVCEPPLKRAA